MNQEHPPYHPDVNDMQAMAAYYMGRLLFTSVLEDDRQKVEDIKKYLRVRQTWRNR
jgi:hypothetical protein